MAAAAWKRLNEQVKAKRTKKGVKRSRDGVKIENGEIVVQRLSAEVTGKAQKFSRIGPREFVSFEYNEVTIENLKRACEKHFEAQLGRGLVCDVLAGEQGPSCKTIEQIPNVKMIHVRFVSGNDMDINIEPDSVSMMSAETTGETYSKKRLGSSSSVSAKPKAVESKSVLQSRSSPSKFYPHSLSVTDMIKLGKLKKQEGTTVVDIYEFAMDSRTWSQVPTTVEYMVEKIAIGEGGFRRAYKATTKHPMFKSKTWVMKRYLPKAVENIIATGISVDDHTKKAVQMHLCGSKLCLPTDQEHHTRSFLEIW